MKENQLHGNIFDIQHFSVSDGPGIRTTIFFKGCPLRCEWCHNPESYLADTQIMFYPEKCIHCMTCETVCPNHCHSSKQGTHRFDRTHCGLCKKCTESCPTNSLETVGKKLSVDDIFCEVLEDCFFYESSGGGITLSGGEPMAQPGFALSIAKMAKEKGLHVCLETSGFCNSDYLKEIMPFIDLFLYDYKATGDENHIKYTGVSQKLILENLFTLDQLGANIILRCPMIPERNINAEHVTGIIHVANKLTHLLEIHLEPYHNIGISKRVGLGIKENFEMITPPERDKLLAIAEEIHQKTQTKTIVM